MCGKWALWSKQSKMKWWWKDGESPLTPAVCHPHVLLIPRCEEPESGTVCVLHVCKHGTESPGKAGLQKAEADEKDSIPRRSTAGQQLPTLLIREKYIWFTKTEQRGLHGREDMMGCLVVQADSRTTEWPGHCGIRRLTHLKFGSQLPSQCLGSSRARICVRVRGQDW